MLTKEKGLIVEDLKEALNLKLNSSTIILIGEIKKKDFEIYHELKNKYSSIKIYLAKYNFTVNTSKDMENCLKLFGKDV